MSDKERKKYLCLTIWFNLLIGIYNLYIYDEMNSAFHLVLGIINIGVWVLNRHRLEPLMTKLNSNVQNNKRL